MEPSLPILGMAIAMRTAILALPSVAWRAEQGEVFVPALLDEFGATAPSNIAFTGTDFNGAGKRCRLCMCALWEYSTT